MSGRRIPMSDELRVKVTRPDAIAKIIKQVAASTTIEGAASKLGIPASTLYRWRREYPELDRAILATRHEQYLKERG